MVLTRETPINMDAGAKIVLHIIPIGAFDSASNFDVTSLKQQNPSPLSGTQWNFRYNFDGLLYFTNTLYSYTQTFRNGIIEAVDAFLLEPREHGNGLRNIRGIHIEKKVIEKLSEYISVQKKLGAEPPFFIMLSLLDVKGYSMFVSSDFTFDCSYQIDRNNLLMSEVMVENFDFEPSKVMKPIFDAVWNACGYPGSQNYDDSANWCG